jgi:hypothetical protein
METFLALCQRTRQECGVSGTGPSTVLNQVGELKRIVDWVATAWFGIQQRHPLWKFLRLSTSWTSVAGQHTYTTLECGIAAGTFARWAPPSQYTFRTYLTATGTNGEFFLDYIPYPVWQTTWQFNANRNVQTQPVQYTITPNKSIAFGPKPPAGYTFIGDYYRAPVRLAEDDDVPALPDNHDSILIVGRAMMLYGQHESAPEVYAQGKAWYDEGMALLEADQLDKPYFGC